MNKLLEMVRSLWRGQHSTTDDAPKFTTDVMNDLVRGVGPDASGFTGNRRGTMPPIAPRDPSHGFAAMEEPPAESIPERDPITEPDPTPVKGRAGRKEESPVGWDSLNFGE